MASSGKLAQNQVVIDMFHNWGYFNGFYMVIGILEFVLAILLLVRKTSLHAAVSLFVIMIGALITHLIHDSIGNVIRPLVFMGFLGVIVYMEWSERN
jgi:hypothetical protein